MPDKLQGFFGAERVDFIGGQQSVIHDLRANFSVIDAAAVVLHQDVNVISAVTCFQRNRADFWLSALGA